LFGAGALNEPYSLVVCLKDESRLKLDPLSSKKLNMLISSEEIKRFEVIFPSIASFD
jgi:hypothetical protein